MIFVPFIKWIYDKYPYLEAILRCEITDEESPMKYSFSCIDKNEKILSSATGKVSDIFVWIENDVLLQGACNLGSEPPPTIITTTQKVTLCEYLKGAGFD